MERFMHTIVLPASARNANLTHVLIMAGFGASQGTVRGSQALRGTSGGYGGLQAPKAPAAAR